MPFREAAAEAQGIVRVVVTGDVDSAPTFKVVEVIRGKDVPKSILVSSLLWSIHRPKDLPAGDVTYLVLLRQGEELLCGHMNGLIIASHTCTGLLPVIGDAIPKEYANRYDGESTQAIEMKQVRRELRRRN